MLIKQKRIPLKEIIFVGILPSIFKKFIYRLRGYEIGKNVSFGFGSVIVGKKVTIGQGTSIGMFTFILSKEVKIDRYVKIGSFTYISVNTFFVGDDTRINENVYVAGLSLPESELRLGKRVIIMQMSFLNPTKPIHIEDDTGIGGGCKIFTHASWQSILEGFPVAYGPVTIKRNVWIAWDVFIMQGVTIGGNSTIGAGSIVNINIPPNSLAVGSPIKIAVSGQKKWPRVPSESQKSKCLTKLIMNLSITLSPKALQPI